MLPAALAAKGMDVHAVYGCSDEGYRAHLRSVLSVAPNIIIDDGGDLVHLMHTEFTDLIPQVIGGCEGDDDRYPSPAHHGPRRDACASR